jgi:serine protease
VCAAIAAVYPASVAHSTVATASKKNPVVQREPIIRQMIVKLRNPKAAELVQPLGADRVTALSNRAGVSMRAHRAMSLGASVLRLDSPLKLSDARAAAARLAADHEVLYAEPDMPVRAYQTVPPDASYVLREWHFFAPTTVYTDRALNLAGNKQVTPTGGANLPGAWSITQGSASVVVALVDSGVTLTHPELAAALLPGRDFVSSNVGAPDLPANFVANDGDGRDADPTDPGDWITAAEQTNFPECDDPTVPNTEQIDSSWHGTHMAGTIVGQWGNGVGATPPAGTSTAGIAPNARLLPVRALGKCGGTSSDVADAMVWAAGLPVPNVPANPNPARIINLSLGSQGGTCGTTYNTAVVAVSAQALVIAASGNDAALAVSQPANCPGVLAVTAHTINGDNADYANIGPEVGISSPGGGTSTQLVTTPAIVDTDIGFYTWSSILFGQTTPTSTDGGATPRIGPGIGGFTGTSGATANVSGVAALVLSAKPSLTPTELRNVLVSHVRAHPAGGLCATGQMGAGQCGSGLLDAGAAVASVAPPPSSGGGGGGALPLAQLLLLGVFALVARVRRAA